MADLGTITYTSVTWTAGDVITEAKLDNMVANDQAYDSHSAQGLLLDNGKAYCGKDSGGTARNLLKINSNDEVVFGFNVGGWIEAGETWTYKSATEVYAAGDVTGKYQKGDKIRYKQGGDWKYGYIIGVSTYDSGNNRTTLTVTGGSDYSVANAAITDNYYSKSENPQGFPNYFNFTVNWTATTTNPDLGNGTKIGRFKINGSLIFVFIAIEMGSTTTYGEGAWGISIPVGYLDTFNAKAHHLAGYGIDLNVAKYYPMASSGAARIRCEAGTVAPTVPFTWASGDLMVFNGSYFYA